MVKSDEQSYHLQKEMSIRIFGPLILLVCESDLALIQQARRRMRGIEEKGAGGASRK
jgi:hypothetical protein